MRIVDHYRCGKHSGFRLCDIVFFVTLWRLFYNNNLRLLYHRLSDWVNYKPGVPKNEYKAGYVMCPLCLLFKRKPVKVIKCECGKGRIRKMQGDI